MIPDQLATNIIPLGKGLWKTQVSGDVSYTHNGHELIKDKEQNSFWFFHRRQCLERIIENYPVKKALDIGGGNGQFSKYLQSIGIKTVLLEPGNNGAKNAVDNGVLNVINGTLRDACFKESTIQSAFLLDVLEHIEDDEAFLSEIYRILEPGGKLILTVPALQFLFSDFDLEVGHYRRYTLRELNEKLIKSGFLVDYKTYFFSLLPIPVFIGRFVINRFKKKDHRKSTGHISKSGMFGRFLTVLLWPEKLLMKYKVKIPIGSSCLFVVYKPKN